MEFLYPAIEPFKSGYFEVDDGVFVYWEASGNPDGIPALFCTGDHAGVLKQATDADITHKDILLFPSNKEGVGGANP